MEDPLKEMLRFLHIGARLDLKAVALTHVLGLTGSKDGLDLIIPNGDLLRAVLTLVYDKSEVISKDAALCLVNVSAREDGAVALVNLDVSESMGNALQIAPKDIVATVLMCILEPDCHFADACCMILSNITRPQHLIEQIVDLVEKSGITFDKIVNAFTKTKFNNKGSNLNYLGPVLSNLTQSHTVRKYILDKEKCVIQRLLPYTEYKDSALRRGGIIGTLKNCCFESEYHSWLLSEEVDILPRLLLPLAGNKEYDEEDNDNLPLELQYLPEDKQREEDPDIRCMLLEALTQLCASRTNREYIRNKNTYVILRELHKWEKDKKALLACENLVDILIRTEEEIGEDNLKNVDVPQDLQEKFDKMDKEFIENE